MLFDVQDREMSKWKKTQKNTELCIMYGGEAEPAWWPLMVSYILEATVKNLQLFAGETCLGFKLFQALGAMADCR